MAGSFCCRESKERVFSTRSGFVGTMLSQSLGPCEFPGKARRSQTAVEHQLLKWSPDFSSDHVSRHTRPIPHGYATPVSPIYWRDVLPPYVD